MRISASLHAAACLLLLSAYAIAQPASPTPAQVLRYTILASDARAGAEVDTFRPGGRLDATFEFNDRGRGPKTEAHYQLSPEGLPQQLDITGVDYLKSPVDEHFSASAGGPHWKSTSEAGTGKGRGFYLSNNGPAVESALLVAALVHAGPAGIPLFPSGTAHLEKMMDTTLHNRGESIHVTAYAITGIGFTPSTLWLDDDLHFFGTPGSWLAILREGWEGVNQPLYDMQTRAENARFEQLATRLAQHPSQPVAIEHVRVFDAQHATTRPDQTVVISGDRILAAGPAASVKVPADARRIEGAGKTLLPGLYDMHAHAQALDGILNIASGVTSIRDMGNNIEDLRRLDDDWQSGKAIGPRIAKAGLIDGRDKMQAPIGLFVSTQQEADAAVKRYADLGYIQIKLYSSLNPAFVPGIVALAHQRGLRVSGHIPNGLTATQFVTEGADELQHINFVFLNFLADKVKDTRTPERFTAVGQYAAGLDLQSKPVNDFIALLLAHHTTVDVTLATFEGMFTGRPGQVSPDFAPILDRLPPQVGRGAYSGGLPATGPTDQLYKDSYTAMLRMTKRLYDAGIPILAGTDSTAGLMLHRELELEVQAGIPAARALQNATWVAAGVLKQQNDFGSIAPGKRADLLLVEGDPTTRIADIRRTRTVFKGGVLFDSNALYAAIGIAPSH